MLKTNNMNIGNKIILPKVNPARVSTSKLLWRHLDDLTWELSWNMLYHITYDNTNIDYEYR